MQSIKIAQQYDSGIIYFWSMKKEYIVEGMTCNGCVKTVRDKLSDIEGITSATVTLDPPMAIVESDNSIELETLQSAVGKYKMTEKKSIDLDIDVDLPEKSITTYKPLIIIVSFIAGVSLLSQYPFDGFSWMLFMRYFMAGFFIVFSFFKLLNLSGFAASYSMYDVVAGKWFSWGYIYPFVELVLGGLYLTNIAPFWTNVATVVILGVSSIGVIQSNLNKRKIKCACLGDVFNLPMSTVTIIENVTMILMALGMLFV